MEVNYDKLTAFRRQLHANPEVSGKEKETAASVLKFLEACHPDEVLPNLGGLGIVATWDSGKAGPEIVFRAELDALPIQEVNDFEYQSKRKGVSHKCGHDGHTTILCGLEQYLSENKPIKGKVRLLFQQAEENGEGAKSMLEDKNFATIHPDYIFALHNLPGYQVGEVVVKDNTFTAAVNSIIIYLHGKTSHAAEPEHGHNPALALAQILKESIALQNNNAEDENMRVISPVYVEMGEKAYGISAGQASIHLTIRCWDDENLKKLEQEIQSISLKIGKEQHLKIEFEYVQRFHANINDTSATAMVRSAAAICGYPIAERKFPFKWGEDFGLFTTRYKGCMFGLGSGENIPALHNPDYDFPDVLIERGVHIFSAIITEIHKIK